MVPHVLFSYAVGMKVKKQGRATPSLTL